MTNTRLTQLNDAPIASLPLLRTAWRRMRQRPFQYILFIAGVALGVAMMVSIDLASGAAGRAFALSTDAIAGKTTHRVFGGPAGIEEAYYQQLKRTGFPLPLAPIVEGFVLADSLGAQPMRLVGVDPFAEPPFRSYFNNSAGVANPLTLSRFLTEPDSVIMSADLAAEYGVTLDQSIQLTLSGTPKMVRVVGLLQPSDEAARRALNGILFADIATAQELLGRVGWLNHIDVLGEDLEQVARLEGQLPAGLRLETATAGSNTVQQMTAAFDTNLTALSMLALVVGMFLIYNTVTFSVVQRRKLFGILRCLGVTNQQLFGLIMIEALFLSLIGSLFGLVLGVVLGQGMVQLVTQTINDFYFVVTVSELDIPPFSLVKGVFIGVAASLFAAAVPAYEAMQTTPNAGLRRSTIEGKTRNIMPWLFMGWIGLTLIGIGLLWFRGAGLVVNFAGLFAILIGIALLAPPLTTWLIRGLTPLMDRLFSAIGRMAARDIVRSLSRTSVAIAALMTAVSVIVGVSIMIGSFRQTVTQWLGETLQADIFISPPTLTASRVVGALDESVVDTVAAWPGVETVVTARQVSVRVTGVDRPVNLVATNGDVSNGARNYAWIAGERDALWDQILAGDGVVISEPLLLRQNWSLPPEPIELMTDDGLQTFPILAVSYDYSSDQGTIVIGRTLYDRLWDDDAVTTMALFAAGDQPVDSLLADLQLEFAGRTDVVMQSNQSIRTNAIDIFDRTFAITAALQLLAVVVAFIGVLSALMSLQLERAQELGILRATGMTVGQLWKLTLIETGLMGFIAGLIAMPTGYILAWILIYVINVRSFGWTLQMVLEPSYFIQAWLVAIVAALLAGLYPSARLGKMTIALALRQE